MTALGPSPAPRILIVVASVLQEAVETFSTPLTHVTRVLLAISVPKTEIAAPYALLASSPPPAPPFAPPARPESTASRLEVLVTYVRTVQQARTLQKVEGE